MKKSLRKIYYNQAVNYIEIVKINLQALFSRFIYTIFIIN